MKKFVSLLPAVFFIFISAAYSQSLSDLANKEKTRREGVKGEVKVIINDQSAQQDENTESQKPDTAAKTEDDKKENSPSENQSKAAKEAKTDPDEPVDFQGRPESFWRKSMADARQKVKDLENEGKTLTLKMAELQTKFYNIDDGFARESVQKEIQKTIYEQDLNKTNLEKAVNALSDLENEARKSGALPGWLGR
jgi:hypothetical protein